MAFGALFGRASDALASVVSLPSYSAAPGSSILLPALLLPEANSISGIQFDLQYDSSVMSLVPVIGDAARNAGKSLYSTDLASNKRRFLIVGLNQNQVSGGALFTLFVNLNPNAPTGIYPLVISNVIASDEHGQAVPATGTDGAVTLEGTIDQSVRLQAAGVLSAASLLPGPVAGGEVVKLIGSDIGPALPQLPDPAPSRTVLAGTRVLFDETPAHLLYAASDQINAVVPYGVAGRATTRIQVTKSGEVIAEQSLPVAPAVPAIFTLDSSGVGPGAIFNEDSNVNSPSNPAARGSVVVLFATGGGQTSPPSTDGQLGEDLTAKSVLPASVEIGNLDADILYVGPVPGVISGILQITCRIPQQVAPGYGVPVVLTVGTARSPAGVTLAVQ